MGFADPARAERLLLTDLGVRAAELRTDPLVTAIAVAADPDLAVSGLARLFARPEAGAVAGAIVIYIFFFAVAPPFRYADSFFGLPLVADDDVAIYDPVVN